MNDKAIPLCLYVKGINVKLIANNPPKDNSRKGAVKELNKKND